MDANKKTHVFDVSGRLKDGRQLLEPQGPGDAVKHSCFVTWVRPLRGLPYWFRTRIRNRGENRKGFLMCRDTMVICSWGLGHSVASSERQLRMRT